MIFFKPNVCFKLKTLDETVEDLISRVEFSNNLYEVSKLKECINEVSLTFDDVKKELKNDYNLTFLKCQKQLVSIEKYWNSIKDEFLLALSNVLNVDLIGEVQTYCLIDCLPFPNIDLNRRRLSLSVSESLDDNIRFALGLIVKYFILKKFTDNKAEEIVCNYDKDSVYWIMADLVADSIFFYSDLNKFTSDTAFKYYYGLKIEDINVIEYIRNAYLKMGVLDFMGFVFGFVKNNIDTFTKFTNRY